jgi:uncharacterized protein
MGFEWDPKKAEANFRKHGIRFSESLPVFEDDHALTVTDDVSDSMEQRFVSIGMGIKGQVLVIVYSFRNKNIRIILARPAQPQERAQYERNL